jgi:uncharacterized protein HemX
MKVSKSMLAAGAVTTFAVASLAGVGVVSAHGSNGNRANENNAQKMEQREEKRTERLQSLVDSGALSEDQRVALETKHKEMHALRDELKTQDLSREERREKMDQIRTEFEAWATEQGIDIEQLRPDEAKGHGRQNEMRRDR